jgi:predicted lipoprotein with Yx(FWY)xxD motif
VALAVSAYGLGTGVAEAKAKPKVVVATATIPGVGKVLVDAQGKTLHDLTNAGQAVPCTGACASVWPPLTLPTGQKLIVAKGVTGVKLNRARQVTAAGLPLYRFIGDTAAKQAHGEGVSSFGGTWHAAKATGATTTK